MSSHPLLSTPAAPADLGDSLYSWQDCDAFDTATLFRLYEAHLGRTQTKALGLLGMGNACIKRAEGNLIETEDGRRILDFTGGIGVLGLGHNHPRILAARAEFESLRRMEHHKGFLSKYMAGLSHNIAHLLPGDLDVSFICNSGAEAVEGALKLAYKYHGGRRGHVLHADNSFHGKLLGSGGLTARSESYFAFPTIPGIESYTYDVIESVETKIKDLRQADGSSDIYAIIVEPYCANHVRGCCEAFLRQLRKLCTRERIILIFDEVYTGWGKTGSLFYFMRHEGLVPDIVTMSKTLGGGKASLSCYTARGAIHRAAYDNVHDFLLHTTTYNGFSEECITAIETIRIIIEEKLCERALRIEAQLGSGLKALQAKYPEIVREVRGCGAHHGLILNTDLPKPVRATLHHLPIEFLNAPALINRALVSALLAELFESHQVMVYCVPNDLTPLILSPSLVTTDEEIERCLKALDRSLSLGKSGLIGRLFRNGMRQVWSARPGQTRNGKA